MESEKKINERINKMEEMIKRDHKMKDLMDYQSLSLTLTFPWCEIASQVQDANLGQVWRDWKGMNLQLKLETLGVEVEYKSLYTCFSSLVWEILHLTYAPRVSSYNCKFIPFQT